MTPLPAPLGPGGFVFWRLDQAHYGPTWDSGEGSLRFGGRWNARGLRVVYAALDPATAILEVAVHKGFPALDTVPHVLTAARVRDPGVIRAVEPTDVPNANWLRPGSPSAGQQAFGAALLGAHLFVLIPSVVSFHSWNLIFDRDRAVGSYDQVSQEAFALDTRLHPPPR